MRIEDEGHRNIDHGPAHVYNMPVQMSGSVGGTRKPVHNFVGLEDKELPTRLRGVRAAYGKALGTAAKIGLDIHESSFEGNRECVAQALEHLTKAVEVT